MCSSGWMDDVTLELLSGESMMSTADRLVGEELNVAAK